ncbi:MAG: hypothetical protein ACF8GE_09895 [Phycisphaerales bacterium JB043]
MISIQPPVCAIALALAAGSTQSPHASPRLHADGIDDSAASLRFIPQTISVDSGETLTPTDLTNGSFMGELFTLGPDLTFEINHGGQVGLPNSAAIYDFSSSILNINSGGVLDSTNQYWVRLENVALNLNEGGRIGPRASIEGNSDVNISGGLVEHSLLINSTGSIRISGGIVQDRLVIGTTDAVISGGNIGNNFELYGTGAVIRGSGFEHNGIAITGLDNTLQNKGDYFSGILEDGTVFIFRNTGSTDSDYFEPGAVTLDQIARRATSRDVFVIGPGDPQPTGLYHGQSLTLQPGAELHENFAAVSAEITATDSEIKRSLAIADSMLTATGTHVRDNFEVFGDSTVTLIDSFASSRIGVFGSSSVYAENTVLGVTTTFHDGTSLEMIGGSTSADFDVFRASSVSLTDVDVTKGVDIYGHEDDTMPRMALQLTNCRIQDSLIVAGGVDIAMDGGEYEYVALGAGTIAHVNGGEFTSDFSVGNAEAHLAGGVFKSIATHQGSKVTITQDISVSDYVFANADSDLSIQGGTFAGTFDFTHFSVVEFVVQDAYIDGEQIDFVRSSSVLIEDRGGAILSGTLANGDSFSLALNESFIEGKDRVSADASLTVTLIPTPSTLAPLALGALALSRRRRSALV